jgi:hypothetical protein
LGEWGPVAALVLVDFGFDEGFVGLLVVFDAEDEAAVFFPLSY